MNYRYRIYPDALQEQMMLDWLEISRKVYNHALPGVEEALSSSEAKPRKRKTRNAKP
ncbi:MAG TPA: helix-turn-helix domain-containing protein [Coleofasciculaceae cyanobacterium]